VRREADLRRRLRALHTLAEAVGAMKNLSAHHFRETRGAVEPARVYRDGVERILGWAGATLPAGDGPPGLLVIGGELGLCGGYNARLVAAAVRRRAELGPGPTIGVGRRACAMLSRRGVPLARVYGAPTSVRGIRDLLLRLAEDLLTSYITGRLSSFDVVSSLFGGVGAERPVASRVLPLEARHAEGTPAVRYVRPQQLVIAAAREYLYIVVYDLLLDALASEHGARLLATQSAESWLDDQSDTLRRHLGAARREASTQEVLEIAAAARASR